MTNYLLMAADVLQSRMERYAGVECIYSRPGAFRFPITLIPGRNPVEVTDQNGVLLKGQVQDFGVRIEDLIKEMRDPKRPLRNDEIIYTLPGAGLTVMYKVNGEDFATGHYEPGDSYGITWRIHTKADRIIDA